MSKCYKCDICGVITVEKEYEGPPMAIYESIANKYYDVCDNCAKIIKGIVLGDYAAIPKSDVRNFSKYKSFDFEKEESK